MAFSSGPDPPPPSLVPKPGPHPAEGRLLFPSPNEALAGVCASEDIAQQAELCRAVTADAGGGPRTGTVCHPHAYGRNRLPPAGGPPGRHAAPGPAPSPAANVPPGSEESAIDVTYPVSSRSLCGGASRLEPLSGTWATLE